VVADPRTALLDLCVAYAPAVPSRSEHQDPGRPLGNQEAEALADAMRAFGTASRVRLLWAMLGGERTVQELTAAVGGTQSATSHQLQLLRKGRLVAVERRGRHAYYRLNDHHVAEMLAAIRDHYEHLTAGSSAER
jgi:DNA-binding transcriptional ArsR family regulator